MKLLVLSDSHGFLKNMEWAIATEHPDVVIHLGDYYRDMQALVQSGKVSCPVVQVNGNCDRISFEPPAQIQTYEGCRLFMTHGHPYRVKSGLLPLYLAAREQNAQVALFGHTHIAYCEQKDGLWLLNPGSCQVACRYAVVEIENGVPTCRTLIGKGETWI